MPCFIGYIGDRQIGLAVGYLPVWLADHTLDLIRAQPGRQNINKIADLSGLQAVFICPQNSGDRDIRGQPVRLYPAIFNTKFRINFFSCPCQQTMQSVFAPPRPGQTEEQPANLTICTLPAQLKRAGRLFCLQQPVSNMISQLADHTA